jgi:hypothetical protein
MATRKRRLSILRSMSEPHIPDPPSESYWDASPDFRALCRRKLGDAAFGWAEPQLAAMGERAAREVSPLAAVADREAPRLVTHDALAASSITPRIARWSASRTARG